MADIIELEWKRPESADYPKVWYTFEAKDTESDELVNYRIEDLPESRSEEALAVLFEYFCKDEPLCEAYELFNDAKASDDFVLLWKSVIKQKMALVCLKDGSNEIVGLNMNFVAYKNEHFMEDIQQRNKSENCKKLYEILFMTYENYDTCEYYGVDKYLTSVGLVVTAKYRGRGIGEHFLRARKVICQEFGIKVTSTIFTSNFSNRLADKAGFKVDKSLSYDEVRSKRPDLKLPPIKSDGLAIKSLVY